MAERYGVIGFPVGHSLSPWIHERFFQKAGINGEYQKIAIDPKRFKQKIPQLLAGDISGFNVTVPYKEAIIPFLDKLDDDAAAIGAVNTVAKRDGMWVGYNTDGIGFVRSIVTAFPDVLDKLDKKVLILGAGGAARGIYAAILATGMPVIDIANRTKESAVKLAQMDTRMDRTSILSLQEACDNLDAYDVIIHTTSVGMEPNGDEELLSLEKLRENAIVSDIVYKPLKTKLLKQAERNGARIHQGHLMLLHQARYAFEIWTGLQVDVQGMDVELQAILEGR